MQTPRHYGTITTPSHTASPQQPATPASATATPNATKGALAHDGPWRKKILLAGIRQAGKTSLLEVVFQSLPPKDTFYLETTNTIRKVDIDSSIVALQFWDCPANILANFDSLGVPLTHFQSIVFVIDVQDDYNTPIAYLIHLLATVAEVNPTFNMNILIHKAEQLSDEFKLETFQYIQSRVLDEIMDHPANALLSHIPLNFHISSVYDHSLYEAVSKIIQRLTPQHGTLENLMNTLVSNSGIAKAFLFDVSSLTYVATDASPVDNNTFELCCDYVMMLASFTKLYKNLKPLPPPEPSTPNTHSPGSSAPSSDSALPPDNTKPKTNISIAPPSRSTTIDSDASSDVRATGAKHEHISRPKAPRRPADGPEDSTTSSPSHSLIATEKAQSSPTTSSNGSASQKTAKKPESKHDSVGGPTSNGTSTARSKTLDKLLPGGDQESRRWSSSSVKLTPATSLAYWQITESLSLVCIIRSETFEKHRGLIEYNVTFFRGAVQKIVQLERAKRAQ
ncbi:hypothetical protein FRB98_003153 [Tulasnella sp. 332]|nr:hypothetical protein FRB98_003153 [Tulasnella sp. 332]